MFRKILLAVVLTGASSAAFAQDFPFWERLLSHYAGKSDATPVPVMLMGHMQMSLQGKTKPGDAEKARDILAAAAGVVSHYASEKTALQDGYKPFFPTGKIGEEIHYTNARLRRAEARQVDYGHPGSILYRRDADGLKAVGVMYTAPQNSTADQLNAIVPLSVGTWHRHVDFCGGQKSLPAKEQFGPDALFGPQGSINTEAECKKAQGLWIPVVLNWMTHVYPNEASQWGGMETDMALEAGAPELPHHAAM